MDREPSEEELRAFVNLALSNLDKRLREPHVLAETIREQREMWVMLYRESLRSDIHDS